MEHNLIAMIVSGEIMSRDDQNDSYREWQEYNSEEILPENLHIFFSYYERSGYEGDAFAFGYDIDRSEFFYTAGGHCSCYGLEGQFDPEYYKFDQLLKFVQTKIDNDYCSMRVEAYKEVLKIIKGDK